MAAMCSFLALPALFLLLVCMLLIGIIGSWAADIWLTAEEPLLESKFVCFWEQKTGKLLKLSRILAYLRQKML